jgi:large subunit ribosomal protein L15
MLTLHNLQKDKSLTRPKKRVGRGDGSGSGTYSGRGMKGQRSRSGGKSGLALRSIKSYLLRIPKVRGFKSIHPNAATVNLDDLQDNFNKGQTITARDLLKKGLIKNIKHGIKILGDGKLSKNLIIKANGFSNTAKEAIIKAGGEAIEINRKKPVKKSNKK